MYSIDADESRLSALLKEVEGKDINELITEGSSKLASVPSGGGGGAAAASAGGAAAAAPAAEEEKPKEEEKEDVSLHLSSLVPKLTLLLV